jgi:GTPase SAR1 family protein
MKKKTFYTHDVFTPTQPAVKNYVEREKIESQLSEALRTGGKQIVIYGHSGSGKTSLLRKNLNKYYEREIITNCTKLNTFDQLLLCAFDELDKYFISESNKESSKGYSAEIKKLFFSIKAERNNKNKDKLSRIVPVQLTPQRLAQFLGEAKCCWVLEDFHKVNKSEKEILSQVLKVFMDTSYDYPDVKIIAIGAVNTAREVINYDKEMQNRVAEIKVPLMNDFELKKIIFNGEEMLNFTIESIALDNILNYSSGLASICHQICLNMCLNKNINKTSDNTITFDNKDFNLSIKNMIDNSSDTLKSTFDSAFKKTKKTKFDNINYILKSILQLKKEELTFNEIFTKIRKINKDYPSSNLTKYLKELTEDKRAKILRFDKTSHKYLFSEPLFRSYVLWKFNEDDKFSEKIKPDKNKEKYPEEFEAMVNATKDINNEEYSEEWEQ